MTRTILKEGRIEFKNTGDVWEGEIVDYHFEEGGISNFKWVGTMTKFKKGEEKEIEKEESGVWKCEDTGEAYNVLEYICDLETWKKQQITSGGNSVKEEKRENEKKEEE